MELESVDAGPYDDIPDEETSVFDEVLNEESGSAAEALESAIHDFADPATVNEAHDSAIQDGDFARQIELQVQKAKTDGTSHRHDIAATMALNDNRRERDLRKELRRTFSQQS